MGIKRRKIKKLRLKKKFKKPQKVLFKIKPLERTKKTKVKKPSKSVKPKKSRTKAKLGAGLTPHRNKVSGTGPKLAKPTEPPIYKTKIKVIGIGGGGSSIVSEIASEVKRVNFVVANTDRQALQTTTRKAKHFQFGQRLTQGLGTGMNPELGEMAAQEEKERIKELLKGTDFCILVSCLGGGTGSGASPVFARILKNLRISTLGIFTLPFEFEGGKRAQIAKDSLEKLKPNLNALVIIPNQKIFQIIDKNTPLKEALSTINRALIENLEGLITLIYSPGLIRVDFADLKTILAGRGRLAYLNSAEAKGPNQIEELTKKVVSSSPIPYTIQGAKEVLFNIDGGLNFNMSQVEQIGKTISISINPQARVAFGITQDKKEGIKITLLVNGCKWKEWEQEKEKPKKKPKEKQVLITKTQEKSKKKTEEKPPKLPKVQQSKITQVPTEEPEKVDYNPPTTSSHSLREWAPIKVRKNALEVQKAVEEEEKKILAQERKWETPAFLRQKSSQINEEKEV